MVLFFLPFMISLSGKTKFKYSGHETFTCRYAWLPKTVRLLNQEGGSRLFRDEDQGMVKFGVGKNMVRSIRFWAESAQVIESTTEGHSTTNFGNNLLSEEGVDPFLEQLETYWLLHWKIATNPTTPIFYWHHLLNFWHRHELTATDAIPFLTRSIPNGDKTPSERTISDGFRIFINTYVPTRTPKGAVLEDNLDSPLVELGLISSLGERISREKATRETVYEFNLSDKPSISSHLFAYCVADFWSKYHPQEKSLSFNLISTGICSPGQVFKLPEQSIKKRLEQIQVETEGIIEFLESGTMPQLVAHKDIDLETIFDKTFVAHV